MSRTFRATALERGPAGDTIHVRITETPGFIARMLGYEPIVREVRFAGSGTVWHILPSCRRAPSWLEEILADEWGRLRWDETQDRAMRGRGA